MSMATHDLATMPYTEYLKTPHWATKRKEALDRASHRCTLCNAEDDLHVHHRTYERRGWEQPDDLIVLCKDCHERFHDVIDGKAQRTVKATHKPQCADGRYLFRMTHIEEAGTFPDGTERVRWQFEIDQAEYINRRFEAGMFTAYTSLNMNPKANMRRWAEALLGREIISGENITATQLLERLALVHIKDGRIKEFQPAIPLPITKRTTYPETKSALGFGVCDFVFHQRFGEGEVTAINRRGTDWEISVDFKLHGKKRLMQSVANLTFSRDCEWF